MTWEELTALLTELADEYETKIHVTHQHGVSAVALHFVPVAWFISMKLTGELGIGVYEGDENRLVGTGSIPLAELTPEFVRKRVQEAAREQILGTMDFSTVGDILGLTSKPPLRDVEGVSDGAQ